jgi:hypothetical protein
MRCFLLFAFPFLTACNAAMYIDPEPGNSGRSLAPGQFTSFRFFTTDQTSHSGVNATEGASYRLEFPIVSNWIDGQIESDENGNPIGLAGFADSQMPRDSYSLLKRSRQHRCRRDSLVGISELNFDAASQSYLYRAPCNGDLKLFVNDGQGFYVNNIGFAHIRITRSN